MGGGAENEFNACHIRIIMDVWSVPTGVVNGVPTRIVSSHGGAKYLFLWDCGNVFLVVILQHVKSTIVVRKLRPHPIEYAD